jgi:hypothetical protein
MRRGLAMGFRAFSDPKISEPKPLVVAVQKTISATSEKTNYDVGMAYRFI